MPSVYFNASFGGVPLLATEISTSRGRDIVVQSPSRGDKHSLSDRGKRAQVTDYSIQFLDQPGLDPYLDRYDAFVKIAEGSEAQLFSHSVDGSYYARIGEITASHNADQLCMMVSCTIYRDDEPDQVFPVGAGVAPEAGLEQVTTAVAATEAALEEHGLETDVTSSALETVTAWSQSSDLDSNQVFLELASLIEEIDEAADTLELLTSLDRWQAYEQIMILRYSLANAAEAFTANEEAIVDLYVDQPRPLIAICAEVYGASEAQDRADEIAKSNRIRTPALIPRGTTLKVPRPVAA